MDYIEVSAKTVPDAIIEACQKLGVASDRLEHEVLEEGSAGFLGIGAKPAVIKAWVKCSVGDDAKKFLKDVFAAMDMIVAVIFHLVTRRKRLLIWLWICSQV